MYKRWTFNWLIPAIALLATAILPMSALSQTIPGTSIPMSVTHLVVVNGTSQPVTMAATLQAASGTTQDGCTFDISDLRMLNVTPGQPQTLSSLTANSSLQGTFTLPSMFAYELVSLKTNPFASNQQQNCLQGVEVTFNQFPSCPTSPPPAFPSGGIPGPAIPNGVSGGEPTINLPGTIGGASGGLATVNESCDITCVNGANSIIQITVTSPPSGALPWFYDASQQIGPGQSLASQNSWVNVAGGCDDNCVPPRPGVFPFGCSQCNRFPDPGPPCGQFCAAANGLPPNNGCNFQRSPNTGNPVTAQFGGTVAYTFVGPAHPPATCGNPGGTPGLPPGKSKGFIPTKDKSFLFKDKYFFKQKFFFKDKPIFFKDKLVKVGDKVIVIDVPF